MATKQLVQVGDKLLDETRFYMFSAYGEKTVKEVLLIVPRNSIKTHIRNKTVNRLVQDVQFLVMEKGGAKVEEVYDTDVRESLLLYFHGVV